MRDWSLNRYAVVGLVGIVMLLACIAIAPSFIDKSNVTLPPRVTPTSTATTVDELVSASITTPPTATLQATETPAPTSTAVVTSTPISGRPTGVAATPIPTATQSPMPSPTPVGPLPPVVYEAGLVRDEVTGQQVWFALLENPNPDWRFEDVRVRVVQVIGTSETELATLELQSLLAGETAGLGELLGIPFDADAATLEILVETGRSVEDSAPAPVLAREAVWQPVDNGGQVGALVLNQSATDFFDVSVLAVVRNDVGEPVAARNELLSYAPNNVETGALVQFPQVAGGTRAELFLARTTSTRSLPAPPPPLVDVVAQSLITDAATGDTLWAAVYESRHDTGTIAGSEVLLTVLDDAGIVLGVRTVDVANIEPLARSAVVVPLLDERTLGMPVRVLSHTRFGEVVEDRPPVVRLEDTLYLDDEGIPRVEAFLFNSTSGDLVDVELLGIAYGPDGSISGAGITVVPELPALGWSFVQVRLTLDEGAIGVEGAEMFASVYVDSLSATTID